MAIKASSSITLSSIRDLQSCTRYYLLQSSTSAAPAKPSTNPPGGNWVTAEPGYTTGSTNSLYFCDLNIFSDGTFAYSDVSLSSSYEAAKAAYNKAQTAQDTADSAQEDIDNLNIGGRNLLRGSNAVSAFSNVHGWVQNGTFTDFAIDSFVEDGETIIHWSATGGGNRYIPSIASRSVAPCEFGETYVYSIDLKCDHAITVTTSAPNHFHAGARETNDLFDTDLLNHLNWIAIQIVTPATGTVIPANTWVRYVRRFIFPNSPTQAAYNYPAIRPFVYGTALSASASDTVNCWMRRCKIEKGNRATDWTPAPEDAGEAIKELAANTECIVGTQTAATNIWTGVASFPTLKDGQVIMYWLPYAGTSTAATLTLTLSTGSTTGGKNVYVNGTTRCTTHIAAGNMVQMVYREGVRIGSGTYTGWWINRSLNDNTYDRIRFNNLIKAKTAITAPRLIVGDSQGYYHLEAGTVFDVDKPILWAGSNLAAGSTGNNNYLSFPSCTLRNNAGSDWVATQYSTLYLAGTLSGKTFTVASEEWLTTNPFDDTLTYISLGYLYSTYQMYFYPEHPMFRLLEGVPTAISQIAYEAQVAADHAQVTADATRTDFQRVVRIDDEGLHVGDNQSNGEVLIDSESVNVVMNGTRYSKFAGNYVQFGNYQLRQSSDGGLVFKMN